MATPTLDTNYWSSYYANDPTGAFEAAIAQLSADVQALNDAIATRSVRQSLLDTVQSGIDAGSYVAGLIGSFGWTNDGSMMDQATMDADNGNWANALVAAQSALTAASDPSNRIGVITQPTNAPGAGTVIATKAATAAAGAAPVPVVSSGFKVPGTNIVIPTIGVIALVGLGLVAMGAGSRRRG